MNDECPACLETIEYNNIWGKRYRRLTCQHAMHEECLANLIRTDCPLCNANIEDELPDDILKKISQNYDEFIERRNNDILADTERHLYGDSDEHNRLPLHIEALQAIAYLRDHNIPLQCVPVKIRVIPPYIDDSPLPEPGVVFEAVVGAIVERLWEITTQPSINDSQFDVEYFIRQYATQRELEFAHRTRREDDDETTPKHTFTQPFTLQQLPPIEKETVPEFFKTTSPSSFQEDDDREND